MPRPAAALRMPAAAVLGSCPYLSQPPGAGERPASIEPAWRCLGTTPPSSVSAQHRAVFCLSHGYRNCSRFPDLAPQPGAVPLRPLALLLGVAAVAAAAAVVYVGNPFTAEPAPPTSTPPPPSSGLSHPWPDGGALHSQHAAPTGASSAHD